MIENYNCLEFKLFKVTQNLYHELPVFALFDIIVVS